VYIVTVAGILICSVKVPDAPT